jgi:hypothetical protein
VGIWVKVATASGEIELSPATHERILTALRHLPPAVALNAFEHAGVNSRRARPWDRPDVS